jgi:cellulose synthase/poly-beta-1,6-N-acetylglucosamine synthase-like glycosyltransferase
MRATEAISMLIVIAAVVFLFYTYVGYPAILWVLGRLSHRAPPLRTEPKTWPFVSFSIPVFNEEHQVEALLQSLLAIDYPRDRLQFLIVSDASSDGTDEIVKAREEEGIELLRMPERGGKTKAEAAAARHVRGEIVVNTDASIRIAPHALKPLIAALSDPEVGLGSGRDISVGPDHRHGNTGESGYVGYEMKIRDLETRLLSIVGASGCFYAIRRNLHQIPLPGALSRDFAAALHSRENGFRAVSVPEAVCYVPRATSLKAEYRRKVRTITRGMDTLTHKRALLNPFRQGLFAWMLFSHKVCRWAAPWAAVVAFLASGVLALGHQVALVLFLLGAAFIALSILGWVLSERPNLPGYLSIPAFLFFGNLAAMHAYVRHLKGHQNAVWEPTRREEAKGT